MAKAKSMKITLNLNEMLNVALKEAASFEGSKQSLKDKARFIAAVKNLTDSIDDIVKNFSNDIRAAGSEFEENFDDLGLGVVLRKGAAISEIDNNVFDEMTVDEIKSSAKITEKALKELGKDDLIGKYKKITGEKTPSVAVTKLKK